MSRPAGAALSLLDWERKEPRAPPCWPRDQASRRVIDDMVADSNFTRKYRCALLGIGESVTLDPVGKQVCQAGALERS